MCLSTYQTLGGRIEAEASGVIHFGAKVAADNRFFRPIIVTTPKTNFFAVVV